MLFKMAIYIVLLFCFFTLNSISCEKYKILVLLPTGGRSHKNVFSPLVEGLAARGHEVTIVSPYKPTKTIPNLKEIVIEENREQMEAQQLATVQQNVGSNSSSVAGLSSMSIVLENCCKNYLNRPETKDMIARGKTFDLVIVMAFLNECAVVVGTMVGKHVIYASPGSMPSFDVGVLPRPPSVVPTTFSPLPSRMNFLQRLRNAMDAVVMPLVFKYMLKSNLDGIAAELLPPNAPTIAEALQKISFQFLNADSVTTPPSPGITNVVGIGAMHCKEAKPLPKDFETYIESSGKDGFIYFSLGSNVPSKYLPIETRQAFLSAFSRLNQKVIWKFEEDLPDKPDNVMTTTWAPQQDLLGHPKIRLFITHGGLLSLQETIYHGVPVIGIPIFGDQPGNVHRGMELGIGGKLEISNITADQVYNTINNILNDKSYITNVKKYSAILRDQPQKPLDKAIFWTEYIIRHNGAAHLRPAGEDLTFIQYFLLDVFALLLTLLLGTTWILTKSFKIALKCFMKKNCTVDSTKKKE